MASTIQKVLRRSKLIDAFQIYLVPNLTLPLVHRQPHENQIKPDPHQILNPSPLLVAPNAHYFASDRFSHFFPSFPLGICLNPISSSVLVSSSEAEDVKVDDLRKLWADSVKKKRKRKMNKHKYRKLRKRLSRQT